MRFKQPPKRINPFIGVLAGFAHPYRDIVFIAKVKILLDRLLIHGHPVLMKSVGELPIKGRSEDFEVRVPLGATQKDYVVTVHFSYSQNDLAVKQFQLWV